MVFIQYTLIVCCQLLERFCQRFARQPCADHPRRMLNQFEKHKCVSIVHGLRLQE